MIKIPLYIESLESWYSNAIFFYYQYEKLTDMIVPRSSQLIYQVILCFFLQKIFGLDHNHPGQWPCLGERDTVSKGGGWVQNQGRNLVFYQKLTLMGFFLGERKQVPRQRLHLQWGGFEIRFAQRLWQLINCLLYIRQERAHKAAHRQEKAVWASCAMAQGEMLFLIPPTNFHLSQ